MVNEGTDARKRLRRILHPTDFSPASRPAFKMALALARRYRADLVLVHVVAPPTMFLEDSYLSARTYQQMLVDGHRQAESRLAALGAGAKRSGVRVKAFVLDGGQAFEHIVRTARRQRADLIVIGTHGRTGLPRLLLGSVARRVAGLAHCPVLTVRAT